MRKIILFLAMSLDGYIADRDGGVGWLVGQDPGADDMVSYDEWIQGIDTVIMGANTYRQITEELSPDKWLYPGLATYVITHDPRETTEEIRFTGEGPCDLVKRLRKEDGKDVWICGGADLAQQLMEADQIDQYYISVIPTILGSGIRLFGIQEKERKLKLMQTKNYHGIVDLVYERR
jgi:dihydrofolate reductase